MMNLRENQWTPIDYARVDKEWFGYQKQKKKRKEEGKEKKSVVLMAVVASCNS